MIFFEEDLSISLNAFFVVANFRLYPRPEVGPLSGANPGIFDSGDPNIGSEMTVELFLWQITSHRDDLVFLNL